MKRTFETMTSEEVIEIAGRRGRKTVYGYAYTQEALDAQRFLWEQSMSVDEPHCGTNRLNPFGQSWSDEFVDPRL